MQVAPEEAPVDQIVEVTENIKYSNSTDSLTVAETVANNELEVSVPNQVSVMTHPFPAPWDKNVVKSVPADDDVVISISNLDKPDQNSDTSSDTYIDKKCVIAAGGKFDGQQAQVTGYDSQANQYQVKTATGAELWFRVEQIQLGEPIAGF